MSRCWRCHGDRGGRGPGSGYILEEEPTGLAGGFGGEEISEDVSLRKGVQNGPSPNTSFSQHTKGLGQEHRWGLGATHFSPHPALPCTARDLGHVCGPQPELPLRIHTHSHCSPLPSGGPGEGPALAVGGGGASTLPGLQHIPLARGTLILWEGVARGGPKKGALK